MALQVVIDSFFQSAESAPQSGSDPKKCSQPKQIVAKEHGVEPGGVLKVAERISPGKATPESEAERPANARQR